MVVLNVWVDKENLLEFWLDYPYLYTSISIYWHLYIYVLVALVLSYLSIITLVFYLIGKINEKKI